MPSTEQYDYETEEYYLSDRTVYGEYINVASSGIQCIQAVKDTAWTVRGDEVTATASGLKGLSVYNMQGVCVKRVAADDASASVSLTDMAAGIYIVRANTDRQASTACRSFLYQAEMAQGVGDAVGVHGAGDVIGLRPDKLGGGAHGHAGAGLPKHRQVVLAVAERDDVRKVHAPV